MLSIEAAHSFTRKSAQQKFINSNCILNSGSSPPNITQTSVNGAINENLVIRKRRACFGLKFKRFNFASSCAEEKTVDNGSLVEGIENNDEIESLDSSSSAYNSENDKYFKYFFYCYFGTLYIKPLNLLLLTGPGVNFFIFSWIIY